MIESLLLTTVGVFTFHNQQPLTNASGFFFMRDERLFLVTSRHVLVDQANQHFPNRIEIELHTDPENIAQSTGFSIPLFQDGKGVWRQGRDIAGGIDVAVIEIDRSALPKTTVYQAFTTQHLLDPSDSVEVGTALLVVGFPLGFHDTLHHIPVARHAVIASSFGMRFQGEGYFLTDGRTHRGTSGAPVVTRIRSTQYVSNLTPRDTSNASIASTRPNTPAEMRSSISTSSGSLAQTRLALRWTNGRYIRRACCEVLCPPNLACSRAKLAGCQRHQTTLANWMFKHP